MVSHATRAKGKVRRYCRSNGLCFLWTLTYATAPTDRKQVVRDVGKFLTRLGAAYGKLPVVAVIERGTRGTKRLHVHLGVDRWLSIDILRLLWGHGHVWVGDGTKCPGQPGVKRLAKYLAKYVAKQYEEDSSGQGDRAKGEHRYLVTQGFSVITIRRRVSSSRAGAEQLERIYGKPTNIVFFDYREEGGVYGYWLEFDDGALWDPPWLADP